MGGFGRGCVCVWGGAYGCIVAATMGSREGMGGGVVWCVAGVREGSEAGVVLLC